MENKKHSQQFLRKRNFLSVLPLLVLPFITMIFWALGGGKENKLEAQSVSRHSGLNLKLPDAKLKSDKGYDKLSFYKQAALDSEKIYKERKLDPYWNKYSLSNKQNKNPLDLNQNRLNPNSFLNSELGNSLKGSDNVDANEAKVYSKLQQLNAALNKASSKPGATKSDAINRIRSLESNNKTSKDIQQLEGLLHAMKDDANSDSEMKQLNNVLDKILAVQHPESLSSRTQSSAETKLNALKVNVKNKDADISLIKSNDQYGNDTIPAVSLNDSHNSFYSLFITNNIATRENAIKAFIPETQTLVSGSTVKLLLGNSVTAKGLSIPENTYIYGTASLNNERLKINIASIQYHDNIFPVSLEVYDLDGLEGIYIPGSISRDVAKQSTDKAVNSVDVTTLDPSLAAQATSAGIQAAKTLISKKVKLIKVTVKAGYQVLLKDNSQKQ